MKVHMTGALIIFLSFATRPLTSAEPEPKMERLLFEGKMSWFGGILDDPGMKPKEGLALVRRYRDLPNYFLREQPEGTTGLGRRLDRNKFYVACRWDYMKDARIADDDDQPRKVRDEADRRVAQELRRLVRTYVKVVNPKTNEYVLAKPVDWGPHPTDTDKSIDLSQGVCEYLGLKTGNQAQVFAIAEGVTTEPGIIGFSTWSPSSAWPGPLGVASTSEATNAECTVTELPDGRCRVITEKGIVRTGAIKDRTRIILDKKALLDGKNDPPTGTISTDGGTITWRTAKVAISWERKDPESDPPPLHVAGKWNSNRGAVTITGANQAITGSWTQPGQKAPGQIKSGRWDPRKRTLTFEYRQPWNAQVGAAVLMLVEDENGVQHLDGSFTTDGGTGSWQMTRRVDKSK
jgi:hypothetical protein